jgi:hypothetical protein
VRVVWLARRALFHEDLRKGNDPLVYAQEYLAEFVDSGVAFFSRAKLLVENQALCGPHTRAVTYSRGDSARRAGMLASSRHRRLW